MITIALLFVDVERGRLILGVAYRVEMSKPHALLRSIRSCGGVLGASLDRSATVRAAQVTKPEPHWYPLNDLRVSAHHAHAWPEPEKPNS